MILTLIQEVPDPRIAGDRGSITVCPVSVTPPAHPFASPEWEQRVILQSAGSSPRFPHNGALLSPWKSTECVPPCLNTFRQHCRCFLSLGQLLRCSGREKFPLKSQEFFQFLPPGNAAYCSNPIHHPSANIYMENRLREGEIDNFIPDILIVGWTAIYLVSDRTYQLRTKFHNCRRLCVATCNKKCGILHDGWSVQCTQICSRG